MCIRGSQSIFSPESTSSPIESIDLALHEGQMLKPSEHLFFVLGGGGEFLSLTFFILYDTALCCNNM